jgi:hypothetical protein
MISNIYVSPKINLEPLDPVFTRADIEFHGVDHAGASFEAAVFLNNTQADESTPRTLEAGYAGSFHIFGHGGCLGDAGHCDVKENPRPYDPRPAHPLTPAKKVVIATDAMNRVFHQGKEVTVTVVPIIKSATKRTDLTNVLKFERLSIVTYC